MGYRSDVYLAVKDETVDQAGKEIQEFLQTADETARRDGYKVYVFTSVKWYVGFYAEVTLCDNWLRQLDDSTDQYDEAPYYFVRIGEEYEDIETRGSYEDFNMYINRSVSY